MAELDEVSQKIGEIDTKLDDVAETQQKQRKCIDEIRDRIKDIKRVDPDDFEETQTLAYRHEWYWRGFFSVIGIIAFFISVAGQQLLRIFR